MHPTCRYTPSPEGGEVFCLSQYPYRNSSPPKHRQHISRRLSWQAISTMRPQPILDGATSDNDEGQWTIVQSKKGRSGRRPTPNHRDFATPTNPAAQLDLQQITRDHDRISAAWREGASYGKLRDVISANLGSHVPLTNAVCLAVGSFDPVPERYTYKRTAHVQLEAFRAMVEILGLHSPEICLACR